jgi:hypothetical protein
MPDWKGKFRFTGLSGAGIFLGFRLILFALLPYRVFLGFGDLINFFRVAQIPGWPFFHYWVEFPPIFPFVSELVYRVSSGTEWIYVYTLAGIFSLFDAGSIIVFWEITKRKDSPNVAQYRLFSYVLIICLFPYSWWYFEPMVVFFFLLSLIFVLRVRPVHAGVALAAGFLVKVFPLLVFIPAWLTMQKRSLIIAGSVFFVIVIGGLIIIWSLSPEFTPASLASQYSKGSWETIWALLDGNLGTGNFGPLKERLDPISATVSRGNAARVPSIIPLAVAGLIGLSVLRKVKTASDQTLIAILGFAWTLVVLASPGWSPQWVLLIIPICLLVFPPWQAMIAVGTLILVNIIEWPFLIGMGRNDLLWTTILLRSIILIVLCYQFSQISIRGEGVVELPDSNSG